jgi:hypothetical protein
MSETIIRRAEITNVTKQQLLTLRWLAGLEANKPACASRTVLRNLENGGYIISFVGWPSQKLHYRITKKGQEAAK